MVYMAIVLAFSTGAVFLLRGPGRDRRALLLGVFFLLVATSFSQGLSNFLTDLSHLSPLVLLTSLALPEAFLPFFAWCFFSGFPKVRTVEPDRLSWWGRTLSLALGIFLFSANILTGLPGFGFLAPFDRLNTVGPYWFLLFGSAVAAFVYAVGRIHRANPEERRRTNLLLFGFVLGSTPVVLLTLLSTIFPPFHRALMQPPWFFLSQIVVYAALLSIPATTVYAVTARGALGVRLVIRAAIRYALARRTLTALTFLPLAALVVVLFLNRQETLAAVVSGPSGLAVLVAGFVGLVGVRFRRPALRSLDQRFFREQYDARQILRALVHGVRDIKNVAQLGTLLSTKIGQALHPKFVVVLTLNPLSRLFEARGKEVPPLPETSIIAGALRGGVSSLEASDLVDRTGMRLSRMEQHWLSDSDAALLVPLASRDGELLGLILLGERKSELPYSREDRGLLADIAAAATEALAGRLFPSLQTSLREDHHPDGILALPILEADVGAAQECVECGQIGPQDLVECPVCAGEMKEAPVPLSLRGVYRLETRIGEGGMGLVYRGFDTALGRPVAIKTLVRVDEGLAARLRHEARAMASVAHPNLATIYGAETWKGRPLILVEYFGAGTLEDRLGRGRLSVGKAIEFGISLAGGIEHLHDLGMLHRDIKPSNIGMSDVDQPKLLDFGLAQLLDADRGHDLETDGPVEIRLPLPREQVSAVEPLEATRTGGVRGTVPYLSPEVLSGRRPGRDSDLWGLAVVLFEAVAGVNPFMRAGGSVRTLAPDLGTYLPDCSKDVAAFFARALSYDPSKRQRTIGEFREGLEGLAAR